MSAVNRTWVEWNGGECPVGENDDVQVMLYGQNETLAVTYTRLPGRILHWDRKLPKSGWIIAYRVLPS